MLNFRVDSNNHLHLIKEDNDIDLSHLERQKKFGALGIEVGKRTVYVDKEGFYQTLARSLHDLYPGHDVSEWAQAVKVHLAAKKTYKVEEIEGWLNREGLFEGDARKAVATAASRLGEARSEAVQMVADGIDPLHRHGGSVAKVFLGKGVLKKPKPRALYEEQFISDFADIALPKATVAQVNMQQLAPTRFGFTPESSLSRQERDRLLVFDEVPPDLKLFYNSEDMVKVVAFMVKSYRSPPEIKIDGKELSFQDLLEGLDTGKFTLSTVVNDKSLNTHIADFNDLGAAVNFHLHGLDKGEKRGESVEVEGKKVTIAKLAEYPLSTIVDGMSLEEHIEQTTKLGQSLVFHMAGKEPQEKFKFKFLPIFENQKQKDAYLACEKLKWKVGGKTVSFQTLHKMYLKKEIDLSQVEGDNALASEALACRVKYVPPLLIEEGYYFRPLSTAPTVAKPRVQHMQLFHNLEFGYLIYHVFSHLTPASSLKAIFTLDAQFMDLHEENIGFVLQVPEEYSELLNYRYNNGYTFYDILGDYVTGKISATDPIDVWNEKGKLQNMKIPLEEAKEWPWEIVLFDLDISFGESNQFATSNKGHYVPIRSILLMTDWKDQELPDETLAELREMDKKMPQIESWLAHDDSPAYHHLNQEQRQELKAVLQEELKNYSFGLDYEKMEIPLEHLRQKFCKKLLGSPDHKIWSFFPSLPANRRLKIAEQLFPRATLAQQKAYKERVENRQAFFKMHEELENMTTLDAEKIREFIHAPYCPMNAFEREGYSLILEKLEEDPFALGPKYALLLNDFSPTGDLRQQFLEVMRKKTKLSYFNIAKAMNPLLADDYELLQATEGRFAGKEVGAKSLEDSVAYKNSLPYEAECARKFIKQKLKEFKS